MFARRCSVRNAWVRFTWVDWVKAKSLGETKDHKFKVFGETQQFVSHDFDLCWLQKNNTQSMFLITCHHNQILPQKHQAPARSWCLITEAPWGLREHGCTPMNPTRDSFKPISPRGRVQGTFISNDSTECRLCTNIFSMALADLSLTISYIQLPYFHNALSLIFYEAHL